MAYVTGYSTVVPYNTSIAITSTDVANAVADLLVANFGYTLISHATAGVASSVTNYAELSWHGLKLRIYNSSTSSYYLYFSVYFDVIASAAFTVIINSSTLPFAAGINVTVSLRKIAYKGGNVCQVLLADGTIKTFQLQSTVQSIVTDQTYYALSGYDISANGIQLAVADGNNVIQYYHTNAYPYDISGTKQILTQIMAGPSTSSSTWTRTFIVKYLYCAAVLTFQGIAEINGKTFYGSGVTAFEVA